MRFNNKELAVLAQQDSRKFDKEGCVYMKQKNDKLFKKGEAFVERFLRVRGNLLFYFKGKDAKSEPLGLLVLERCAVELQVDVNEAVGFSFIIVYEGDEQTYTFCTRTEVERDAWIQVLHEASYECLKMKLQSLKEQVQAKTGRDPLAQMLLNDTEMEHETRSGTTSDDPAMEISLAIEGLPNDSNGQPPNPFVVIYTIIPPEQQTWLQHSHTEMVEKNNCPHFLKTIGFGDSNGVDQYTRVKITVYHVKERMTGTMSQVGQLIFTLSDLLVSSDMSLSLPLCASDASQVGEVQLMAWLNESVIPTVDNPMQSDVFEGELPQAALPPKKRSKRLDTLKPICENITTRTFRFDTNEQVKLLVYEYMAESKFTFDIPIKLLKLYIEEEQARISQLQNLGKLPGAWQSACQMYMDICLSCITVYSQHIRYLSEHKASNFKPSTKKGDKELEFVPVNLHLQRMTVINETTDGCGCYDTITVGAFTAFSRKFRSGGVWKLLQQQQEQYTPEGTLSKVTKIKRACAVLNNLYQLQLDIEKLCSKLCHEALQGNGDTLQRAKAKLAEKVKELVLECESSILQDTATKLGEIHEEFEALEQQSAMRTQSTVHTATDKSPDKSWKWTGSCFVKSPTVEPWDMTRVNTEASLVCLTSMVDDLIENRSGPKDRPKWLSEISPAVIKLKSFVDIVCQRASHFLSFLDLMEHKDNLKFMHMVKCRRDVCFSQALTSLVTAMVGHIHTRIDNPAILGQLATLGVLVEMEGLLSCHGDEMAMLEDMVVAFDDLGAVTFRLVPESPHKQSVELSTMCFNRSGLYPDLNRHHVCVDVSVKKAVFEKLPASLQAGKSLHVIPVLFNVGFNEQATLAERFGNTGLQDRTNEESLGRLHEYVKGVQDLDMSSADNAGVGTIPDLIQQLRYNVYAKKSKNVEILHIAAELCRKVHGIRFTCCKSAKDRTAMAVTLEQVQILQKEHNLASHVFSQALDCFRSEGVRRENVYKNIGSRKYAFNSLQLLSFPKQYRPPNGTYGNVQS